MVAASDLASKTVRVDGLQASLDTMARLANRLATMEAPQARQAFKPKEVKDPELFAGNQADLKRFKNQLLSYPLSWPVRAVSRMTNIG